MGVVSPSAEQVRYSDANATGEHHEAAAETVDEHHREHGEGEVNGAGNHDVEEYIVGSVAGTAINLGGVVEEDVDAGPLLERSESDPHEEDLASTSSSTTPP